MSFMPILDVAIGLSLLYLLLALVSTTLLEMIAGWRKTRATFLDRGIQRLLGGDAELTKRFFQHPLISSLAPGSRDVRPSYIPAHKFATVLLDLLSGTGRPRTDLAAVRAGTQALGNDALRQSLTALLDSANDQPAALKQEIELWFNDGMDRVSGWYKRNSHRNALVIAAAVTLILNVDTLLVTRLLWTNPAIRAAVVEDARVRATKASPEELPLVEYQNPDDATESTIVASRTSAEVLSASEQKLLGSLTGWEADWESLRSANFSWAAWLVLLAHLPGWIITALAVSLGAPFWFDTLNRFMSIRNAGRAPDERRDKTKSAARQADTRG